MRSPEFWIEDSILSRLLSPIGCAYGYAAAVISRRARPFHIDHPVVCVGNLVAGGAGKTPIALSVADQFLKHGYSPQFLTRGYGGNIAGPERVDLTRHTAADVGDEALLLARRAPTWVSHNRIAGALAAESSGADIIVMDDGLQNHELRKDLSLVVIDGGYGIGNGRVMPAGPLREFQRDGLSRADAIVLVGPISDRTSAIVTADLPVFEVSVIPVGEVADDGRKVVAFAGIGLPNKFYATLRAAGVQIVETRSFPDHHVYSESDIAELKATALCHGAKLVTTEKDFVRLNPSATQDIEAFPISVEWRDRDAFQFILSRILGDG